MNSPTPLFGCVISPTHTPKSIKVMGLEKTIGGAPPNGVRTLIAYGTRYGATAGTSEEITGILREEGYDVKLVQYSKKPGKQ